MQNVVENDGDGVAFGCRASISLQVEPPPLCSLGKNVHVSIRLVISLEVR